MTLEKLVLMLDLPNFSSVEQITRLRRQLGKRPYYLDWDFAKETIAMAALFAAQSNSPKLLANKATAYAHQQAAIYNRYLQTGRDVMAADFEKESKLALAHCLKLLNVGTPGSVSRAIIDVGHYIGRIPRCYGVELLNDIVALDRTNALSWLHWVQLAKLACGPHALSKPALTPWLGPYEGVNKALSTAYDKNFAENAQLWRAVRCCVLCHTLHAIDWLQTPLQLERDVRRTLRQPPRGRPPKRVFDINTKVELPDIPID
jgi:hypothetical protein